MSVSTTFLTPELYEYFLKVSLREPALLAALREETNRSFKSASKMQTAAEQAQFIALLIKLMGAKRVIEIGTFTGYTALAMAMSLPPNGKVVTCDKDKESTAFAQQFWKQSGFSEKIELYLGPAKETLSHLIASNQSYEFIYIDADKSNIDIYYEQSLRLLGKGGVVAIDNVLWGGRVADESIQNETTMAIRNFNQKIHADERIDLSLIPIGDGLTLARKK